MSVQYQSKTIGGATNLIYSYYASEGIDKGMCLCFDESKEGQLKCEWVKPSPVGAKAYMGIAITSASAGGIVQVQQSGYVDYVLVSGSMDCGNGLVPSETDAGVLINSSHPLTRDHNRPLIAMTTADEPGIYNIDGWLYPTSI